MPEYVEPVCENCGENLEFCDNHGWEGNDGSSFCDLRFQPGASSGIYSVEHSIREDY